MFLIENGYLLFCEQNGEWGIRDGIFQSLEAAQSTGQDSDCPYFVVSTSSIIANKDNLASEVEF